MGTRGTLGFVIDGEEKLAYNHHDSYPTGIGVDVLSWARGVESWDDVREQARALMFVSDDVPPTVAQIERLGGNKLDVPTGTLTLRKDQSWYDLLYDTQGKPAAILEAGFMENASTFPMDGLFCEWGYVIDLDHEMLEVYRGFQKAPHDKGRFGKRPVDVWHKNTDYYPIAMVAAWSLRELPSESEFLDGCGADD
jgi:hypothetical protein